jgi:flagellar motor component MotA
VTDDPLIRESEEAEVKAQSEREARAANLFDLRRIIGGLFVVYGVILAIVGLTDSQQEIDKAAGININLWTGLAMLVVGGLFILWALWRPLAQQLEE